MDFNVVIKDTWRLYLNKEVCSLYGIYIGYRSFLSVQLSRYECMLKVRRSSTVVPVLLPKARNGNCFLLLLFGW